MSFEALIDLTQFKALDKMSKAELKRELELHRRLFQWLNDEARYFLVRIGQPIRIVRRDYKEYLGELLQPTFSLNELEVGVYQKVYDYNTGKYMMEKKIIKVPVSAIFAYEFIQTRTPAEEVDESELELIYDFDEGGLTDEPT